MVGTRYLPDNAALQPGTKVYNVRLKPRFDSELVKAESAAREMEEIQELSDLTGMDIMSLKKQQQVRKGVTVITKTVSDRQGRPARSYFQKAVRSTMSQLALKKTASPKDSPKTSPGHFAYVPVARSPGTRRRRSTLFVPRASAMMLDSNGVLSPATKSLGLLHQPSWGDSFHQAMSLSPGDGASEGIVSRENGHDRLLNGSSNGGSSLPPNLARITRMVSHNDRPAVSNEPSGDGEALPSPELEVKPRAFAPETPEDDTDGAALSSLTRIHMQLSQSDEDSSAGVGMSRGSGPLPNVASLTASLPMNGNGPGPVVDQGANGDTSMIEIGTEQGEEWAFC